MRRLNRLRVRARSARLAITFAWGVGLLLFLNPAMAVAQTFQLSGVIFPPSDYLAEDELQAAVAPYLDRDIVFADVEKMLDAVQALYLKRGIVTARAIIEPQDVVDGRLRLTLVEASIDTVRVEGAEQTRPEFVLDRLSTEVGAKPDFDTLARDLRLFDIAYDIRPRLTFAPGLTTGTASAVVTIEEPARWSWIASYDNFAVEDLGRNQLSLTGTVRSLTGMRDTLTARLAATAGSEALSVFYKRPVGLRGGSVNLAASVSHTEVVRGEFSILDVQTDEASLSIGYAQPFRIGRDRYWTWQAAVNVETSESALAGTPLQAGELVELDLGIGYRRQGAASAWSLSVGVKLGEVDTGSASLTDGPFALLYGDLSYARRVSSRYVFDADVDWQIAEGQNLSVKRRIAAGGSASLRGYPKDIRSGDSGAVARLQLACPAPCFAETDEAPSILDTASLSPFAFVDMALIRPFAAPGGTADRNDFLASAGVGARVGSGKVGLLGYVGVPLVQATGLTDMNPRLYLGADYAF